MTAAALLLAACGAEQTPSPTPAGTPAGQPTATPASSPDDAPSVVDRVIISTTAPIVNLDTAKAPYTAPASQAGVLASGGYLYSHTRDGSLEPELAEDFPVYSDGGLTATIRLRPNLVYSDGTPVEAQDVVVALNRYKEGATAAQAATFDSAEAPDARTVIFRMNAPQDLIGRIQFVGIALMIHPRDRVDNEAYWERPVSAGRYVVTEWTPGGPTMILEANPNYWRGTPAIQRIELRAATDPTSRVLQVTTGAVDVAFDIPVGIRADLPSDVVPLIHPIGNVFWVGIRSDVDGPLGDVRVRQAICLAIDRDAINERAFLGIAEPVAAVLSRYRAEWEYTPILPQEGRRDLDAARTLLADAGYSDGFTFPLQTWGARPGWTDAAVVISENLAEVGITAEVQAVEDAVAIQNLINSNLDAQFSGGGGDNRTLLHNVYNPGDFWATATRFDVPEVTELLSQLRATIDAAESQRLQVEVQRQAWELGATICPLNERAIVIGSRVSPDLMAPVPSEQVLYVETITR